MLYIERIIKHKCINLCLTESVLQKLDIGVKFNIEKSLHELYNTSRMLVDECNKSTYFGIILWFSINVIYSIMLQYISIPISAINTIYIIMSFINVHKYIIS